MTKKRLLSVSAAALVLGAGTAMAVEQDVIDAIVAQLAEDGYVRIEIDVESNGLEVEAYGDGREGEFFFDLDGNLVRSEVEEDDSRSFGPEGTYIDIDEDDEEDDDDDDDDDEDDEDDDEDDAEDEDGEDDDGEDDDDD